MSTNVIVVSYIYNFEWFGYWCDVWGGCRGSGWLWFRKKPFAECWSVDCCWRELRHWSVIASEGGSREIGAKNWHFVVPEILLKSSIITPKPSIQRCSANPLFELLQFASDPSIPLLQQSPNEVTLKEAKSGALRLSLAIPHQSLFTNEEVYALPSHPLIIHSRLMLCTVHKWTLLQPQVTWVSYQTTSQQ